jgi:hypothetical protein
MKLTFYERQQGLEGFESSIREPPYREHVGRGLCPVMPSSKRHTSPKTRWSQRLPSTKSTPGGEAGSIWPGGWILFILGPRLPFVGESQLGRVPLHRTRHMLISPG